MKDPKKTATPAPEADESDLVVRQFELKGEAARRFRERQRKMNIDATTTAARKLILDQLDHLDAVEAAA